MFEASPSLFGADQLKEDVTLMERALIPLQARMQELIENSVDEKAFKAHEADLKEYTEKLSEVRQSIMDAISQYLPRKDPVTTNPDADNDGDSYISAADGGPRQMKVNTALRPEKLTTESTPRDLRIWVSQFCSYYETSCMEHVSVEAQQAYFKQCLDKTLRFRLERRIDRRTPIWGDLDSCDAYLQEEFLESYPLFNRRMEFFRLMQPRKQNMSDFMSRCRELWNEGDLHSLENEDLLLFKYLYACTDKELRKEMLKIEEPTAIKMEQFV